MGWSIGLNLAGAAKGVNEQLQQELENQFKREELQSQIAAREEATEYRKSQQESTRLYRESMEEDRRLRREAADETRAAKDRAFTMAKSVSEDPSQIDVSHYPAEWQERVRSFELGAARHYVQFGQDVPKDVRDNFYKKVWDAEDKGASKLLTPEEEEQRLRIHAKEAETSAAASERHRRPTVEKPYANWNVKQYGPAEFPTGAQKWVYGITQRAKTMEEAMDILNDEYDRQVEMGNTHLSLDVAARKLAAAMRAKLSGKDKISIDLGALGGKPEGGLK